MLYSVSSARHPGVTQFPQRLVMLRHPTIIEAFDLKNFQELEPKIAEMGTIQYGFVLCRDSRKCPKAWMKKERRPRKVASLCMLFTLVNQVNPKPTIDFLKL